MNLGARLQQRGRLVCFSFLLNAAIGRFLKSGNIPAAHKYDLADNDPKEIQFFLFLSQQALPVRR